MEPLEDSTAESSSSQSVGGWCTAVDDAPRPRPLRCGLYHMEVMLDRCGAAGFEPIGASSRRLSNGRP